MINHYDPSKAPAVPAMLEKYKGREQELVDALVKRFGPEPPQTVSSYSGTSSYRQRVDRFLRHYDPAKLEAAAGLLEKYKGKEDELIRNLTTKYGPEPSETISGPTAAQGLAVQPLSNGPVTPPSLAAAPQAAAPEAQAVQPLPSAPLNANPPTDALPSTVAPSTATQPSTGPSTATTLSVPSTANAGDLPFRIRRMIDHYEPAKAAATDALLEKFKGNELSLLDALKQRLGPEPPLRDAPASIAPAPTPGPSDTPPGLSAPQQQQPSAQVKEPSGAVVGATANLGQLPLRDRVLRVIQHYEPANAVNAEGLLEKYRDREALLLDGLVKRYGPEPPLLVSTPSGSAAPPPLSDPFITRVTRFLAHYDPPRAADGVALCRQYVDREAELIRSLVTRYGPEPPSPREVDSGANAAWSVNPWGDKSALRESSRAQCDALAVHFGLGRHYVDDIQRTVGPAPDEMTAELLTTLFPDFVSPLFLNDTQQRTFVARRLAAFLSFHEPERAVDLGPLLQQYRGRPATSVLSDAILRYYGNVLQRVAMPSVPVEDATLLRQHCAAWAIRQMGLATPPVPAPPPPPVRPLLIDTSVQTDDEKPVFEDPVPFDADAADLMRGSLSLAFSDYRRLRQRTVFGNGQRGPDSSDAKRKVNPLLELFDGSEILRADGSPTTVLPSRHSFVSDADTGECSRCASYQKMMASLSAEVQELRLLRRSRFEDEHGISEASAAEGDWWLPQQPRFSGPLVSCAQCDGLREQLVKVSKALHNVRLQRATAGAAYALHGAIHDGDPPSIRKLLAAEMMP